MTITLICTGKTSEKYVEDGMRIYIQRLGHYCKFILYETDSGKGSEIEILKKETGNILKMVKGKDFLILMDEKGKEFSSFEFAQLMRNHQNISTKNLVFLTGGSYGFSEKIYCRANMKISLSKMTFPHQMVRLIFLEQLYRAYTILKGEKYHH